MYARAKGKSPMGGLPMPEDSDWWNYWKKRMMEQEIVELKDEIAQLESNMENSDDSEDSAEAQEYEEE
jgi:hypothetical protein